MNGRKHVPYLGVVFIGSGVFLTRVTFHITLSAGELFYHRGGIMTTTDFLFLSLVHAISGVACVGTMHCTYLFIYEDMTTTWLFSMSEKCTNSTWICLCVQSYLLSCSRGPMVKT